MTPIQVWQLLIFAAYAFGHRSNTWLLAWLFASLLVQVGLMVWRAIQQVRAEEAKQTAKRAGKHG